MKYQNLVPDDTFIGRYMKMMSNQETPYAYDFWCALWVMSVIMGRRVFVDRPNAPVYMNWYVLLIAESGVTRKSSAILQAANVAHSIATQAPLDIRMLQGKTTPERFEELMHYDSAEKGHCSTALSVSELIRFMGKERYNMALPGLFTDLYDCPSYRTEGGTVGRGERTYRNVFLTFLSASTPSWLHRGVNPDVVSGGFTSRCMFIHSEKRKKAVPWPIEPKIEDKARMMEAAHEIVKHIRTSTDNDYERVIPLNDGAMDHFASWYQRKAHHSDTFRSTFESREDAHVLRLAACLAANDGSWVIEVNHLKKATQVILSVKENGYEIFGGTASEDKILLGIDRVRQKLIEAGREGIKQKKLSDATRRYIDNDDLLMLLQCMMELHMVNKLLPQAIGKGRPPVVWQGTTALVDESVLRIILEKFDPTRER